MSPRPIRAERFELPQGVPVYFHRLPDIVQSVSLRWLMFTGSADDDALRAPGIYHWFEHLPSRGTRRFPDGYTDTERRLAAGGGDGDAHTLETHTAYSAWCPLDRWRESADVLTDMIAQPLLEPDRVEAERPAILEELNEYFSSAGDYADYRLQETLWPDHPLGHHPIGHQEVIEQLHASVLGRAFTSGYGARRAVLLAAAPLDWDELRDKLAECAEHLPRREISERRRPTSYGPLPDWKAGERTELPTDFDSSVVTLLFEVPPWPAAGRRPSQFPFLNELFTAGGLGSPLYKVLRQQHSLVYSTSVTHAAFPDGGYWGFVAQTSPKKVERVIDSFWQVIRDPEVVSAEWLAYVKDSIRGYQQMRGLDPAERTAESEMRLTEFGEVISDEQYLDSLIRWSLPEVADFVDSLTPARSHTVIFRGH